MHPPREADLHQSHQEGSHWGNPVTLHPQRLSWIWETVLRRYPTDCNPPWTPGARINLTPLPEKAEDHLAGLKVPLGQEEDQERSHSRNEGRKVRSVVKRTVSKKPSFKTGAYSYSTPKHTSTSKSRYSTSNSSSSYTTETSTKSRTSRSRMSPDHNSRENRLSREEDERRKRRQRSQGR